MRNCKECGGEFKPIRDNHRFCSKACQLRSGYRANRQRLEPSTCEQCGKEYKRHVYHAAQRFCSRGCAVRAQPRGKRYLSDRACEGCGTVFRPDVSTRRFCSRACWLENGTTRRYMQANGYVRIWVPPGTPGRSAGGRMSEHRYVMQQKLGRPLTPRETVHHINGDKADNRPENLQVHDTLHGKGSCWRCTDCGSHHLEPVEL